MQTKRIIPIIFLSIILSACASTAKSEAATETPFPIIIPNTPTPEPPCSIIKMEATPIFASSPFSVKADDLIIGNANAPVTVVQYCDLQSVDCYGVENMLRILMKNHPNDMRRVIRVIPLLETKGFDNSKIAAQAMIAAKIQNKEMEMHNLLFDKYALWANLSSTSAFENWLYIEVPALELDVPKFKTDLKSADTVNQMTEAYAFAKKIGVVPPYPLVLLNGIPLNVGLLYYEYLDQSISLIALGSRQFSECPPYSVDPLKQYIATIHTEKGDIVIQLFPDKAPLAVNSFIFLARQGWFNGVTFHRVIPGYVAQTGDPSGTGQGGPGYFFKNEINDLKFDKAGVVAMFNTSVDTNGSQFFIAFAPAPRLDGIYTIFGQVIKGMEVVESLTARDPNQGIALPAGDKITSVDITEK